MEVHTTHQLGMMPTEFPMERFNQSVIKHKTGLPNLAAGWAISPKPAVSWVFPEIPFTAIRPPVMRVWLKRFLRSPEKAESEESGGGSDRSDCC